MTKRTDSRSRGQSLVEAALSLPILVMLLLGLLDFGRAYYALVALRDAADEGASYAAISPLDVTGIRQRASEASWQLVTVSSNDVAVTYPASLYIGAPITVTTTYTVVLYTPFASSFVPDNWLALHGQSVHALIETN